MPVTVRRDSHDNVGLRAWRIIGAVAHVADRARHASAAVACPQAVAPRPVWMVLADPSGGVASLARHVADCPRQDVHVASNAFLLIVAHQQTFPHESWGLPASNQSANRIRHQKCDDDNS